jgi:uncharacterized protein YxeA
MKKIILILSILTFTMISLYTFAQSDIDSFDCSQLIVTDVDKVTGKETVGANKTLIVSDDGGETGFGIYIARGNKSSIIFSILAVGAGGCIEDDAVMNVLFRDGTRVKLTNSGKFNCDSHYTQVFGNGFGNKKELEFFRTKQVETIRIWVGSDYVQKDFELEQSEQLLYTINCLSN